MLLRKRTQAGGAAVVADAVVVAGGDGQMAGSKRTRGSRKR